MSATDPVTQAQAVGAPVWPQDRPFTALVAAWNEAKTIAAHIDSFLALDWPDAQLVVCAGGDDATLPIARSRASEQVTVLEQLPGMGKQRALRQCIEHARHDLIFLTDADCVLERSALRALLAAVSDDGPYEAATGGSVARSEQLDRPLIQYQMCRRLSFEQRVGPEADGILGRNAVLTRRALDTIGGFGAEVATGTDFHMSMRLKAAGIPIAFVRESRVPTTLPETAAAYLGRWRRWIKNELIHDPSGRLVPFARSLGLAATTLSAPAAVVMLPWWLAAVPAAAFLAALTRRVQDLVLGRNNGIEVSPHTFLMVPVFLILDQVAVVAAAVDVLTLRGRTRW